jgi:hypothetical protein
MESFEILREVRSMVVVNKLGGVLALAVSVAFLSCSSSRSSLTPTRKYSAQQLRADFDLYRDILETHHPSLYWYTPRDSMDFYFQQGRDQLRDSMMEPEFRRVLSWVTSHIRCGHTSIRSSKAWLKYSDTVRLSRMFPLSMKTWEDHMVVTQSLLRRDTIFRRGTRIAAINGVSSNRIVDSLFTFLSTDGYNTTHKYQVLSNRGFFGSLYTSVFGNRPHYDVDWMDSTGAVFRTRVPAYTPATRDTGRVFQRQRQQPVMPPQPSRRDRKRQQQDQVRLLKIDTTTQTAMMELNSFGRGYGLRRFFRNSYKTLNALGIRHLIIDVRSNGGGSVNNSTLATRYIAKNRFRLSDSLYATRKGSRFDQYIDDQFWNKLFILFLTSKKKDGNRHFGYFERHYFSPKKKHHYNGKVYILTGGNSFSATTLFTSALKDQENVTVIGEETGGGAYGNSAWLIPDVTLPETGVRFRLPLFRLVINKELPKNGRGVMPEVFSGPTLENVKAGNDYKLDTALELIRQDKENSKKEN